MKIIRTRTLHLQPRQYEFIDVSATIEFDSESDACEGRLLKEYADEILTSLLEDEITEAASVTDNPKSFIATYRYSGE
jgi:hypothetical protein